MIPKSKTVTIITWNIMKQVFMKIQLLIKLQNEEYVFSQLNSKLLLSKIKLNIFNNWLF